MKKIISVILALALGIGVTLSLTAYIEAKGEVSLVCDENGEFTILVVSDPQCSTLKEWNEAKNELETLVQKSNPDFVLINGDMNSNNKIPAERWEHFIEPLIERGIFWSTTNGNHDPYQEEIYEMYKSHPLCLNTKVSEDDPNYEEARPMNYVIPIYANDGKTLVFAIYGMDTGDKNEQGYEGLTEKQISWYETQSKALKEQNGGTVVTSILCMHIPLPQVIDMYYSMDGGGTAVSKEPGGIYPVYGIINAPNGGMTNYTTQNGTKVNKTWIHTTAVENDRGMFDKIQQQGDVKGVFFGHDHQTNLVGSYKGILLGFAGKLSTGSYSDELCRGGRVVKFNQEEPEKFTVSWIGAIDTSKDQPAIYSDGRQAE